VDAKAAQMLMDAGISLLNPAPALAKRILSKEHFRAFLFATPADKRKAAYDAIVPHLAFKVPSFTMFMGVGGKKAKRIAQKAAKTKMPRVTFEEAERAAAREAYDRSSDALDRKLRNVQ
jgi:hypothetical protein